MKFALDKFAAAAACAVLLAAVPTEAAAEPLALPTTNPGPLVDLSNFPPKADLYQLQNPVDLVLPDNTEEAIASIGRSLVKVGGL